MGRGGNTPTLSLVYLKAMKKSILFLIISACILTSLAFTVFSKFKIVILIMSAILASASLILAIKNKRED